MKRALRIYLGIGFAFLTAGALVGAFKYNGGATCLLLAIIFAMASWWTLRISR